MITFLSSIPAKNHPEISFLSSIPHFDKVIHFILYGIWGGFIAFSFKKYPPSWINSSGKKIIFFIFIFFLAALDEFHQSFVPGRYMDTCDFLADILGFICFYYIVRRFL